MTLPALIERQRDKARGAVGMHRVVIEQVGQMRLKPDADWVPFTAEQWMAVDEVAFCWHARVKMAPLLTAIVEDAYEDGHGRLDAKLWGAIPVAHDEGPEIDRGEVQRYLAELPWNPQAFFANAELNFEERGPNEVRVWVGDPTIYVDLVFDAAGDIVGARCSNRPYADEGPRSWEGAFSDYQELGGVRLPTRGEVWWDLDEGRYTYWKGEVTAFKPVLEPRHPDWQQ